MTFPIDQNNLDESSAGKNKVTCELSAHNTLNLSGIPTFKYSTVKTPKSTVTFYGLSDIEKEKIAQTLDPQ